MKKGNLFIIITSMLLIVPAMVAGQESPGKSEQPEVPNKGTEQKIEQEQVPTEVQKKESQEVSPKADGKSDSGSHGDCSRAITINIKNYTAPCTVEKHKKKKKDEGHKDVTTNKKQGEERKEKKESQGGEGKGLNSKNKMGTLYKGALTPGGYGGLVFKMSQISGTDIGYILGFRGAFIANHTFTAGVACNILLYPHDRSQLTMSEYSGEYPTLFFSYGGLFFEYFLFPTSPINISLGVTVGVGGVASFNNDMWGMDWRNIYEEDMAQYMGEYNLFFVVEPEINLNFTITRYFRVVLGISYRRTVGVNFPGLTDETYSGFGGTLSVQLGWF